MKIKNYGILNDRQIIQKTKCDSGKIHVPTVEYIPFNDA
jgi:hypothetical protein